MYQPLARRPTPRRYSNPGDDFDPVMPPSRLHNAANDLQEQAMKEMYGLRMWKKPGGFMPLGHAGMEEYFSTVPRPEKRQAVREFGRLFGIDLPSHGYGPDDDGQLVETVHVAHLLNNATRRHLGKFFDWSQVARDHGPRVADRVMAAHVLVNGVDEVTHQLQKGTRESGIDWYAEDLKRLEAGLVALFGKPFGRLDPRTGWPAEATPRLGLFKVLMAPLSYGNNPLVNLSQAVHAYEIAAEVARKRGLPSPFMALPPHTGIERSTGGRRRLEDAYAPNPVVGVDKDGNKLRKYLQFAGRAGAYVPAFERIGAVVRRFKGDETAALRFFLEPQPYPALQQLKPTVSGDLPPLPEGVRRREGQRYEGAYLFGPKGGAFALNLSGLPEKVTKDMWFSRSWNRLLGTLIAPRKEKGLWVDDIRETPRSPAERKMMDDYVEQAADSLGLTPAEFQAAWWYFEQGLWAALGAKADSYSFRAAVEKMLRDRKIELPPFARSRSKEAERRRQAVREAERRRKLARAPLPADPFAGLRAQAGSLLLQGRMPTPAGFLEAIVQTARSMTSEAAGHRASSPMWMPPARSMRRR